MLKTNLTNWQLHTTTTEDWAWYSDICTEDELNMIIALGEAGEIIPATTGSPKTDIGVKEVRSSNISWIAPNVPGAEWLFRRLTNTVILANDTYFKFDLSEIEHLQYTRYCVNDYYDWHKDMLYQEPGRNIRKLSFSLFLDDPEDYEGGNLELMLGKTPIVVEPSRGKIVFFPGYILHRVTPVTRGMRRSLVGWVKGPGWR